MSDKNKASRLCPLMKNKALKIFRWLGTPDEFLFVAKCMSPVYSDDNYGYTVHSDSLPAQFKHTFALIGQARLAFFGFIGYKVINKVNLYHLAPLVFRRCIIFLCQGADEEKLFWPNQSPIQY